MKLHLATLFLAATSFALGAAGEVPYYGVYRRLPLTAIHPHGWLLNYLENQRDGLTGHLEEAGFPYNTVGWAGDVKRDPLYYPKEEVEYQNWWPYEQTAYYTDGVLRTGLLLNDDFLIEKARKAIRNVVRDEGLVIPRDAAGFLWPQAVFFRALQAEYEATRDQKLLDALHNYLLTIKPEIPPRSGSQLNDMTHTLSGILVETILWTYGKTGDERLLKMAEDGYKSSTTPTNQTGIDREVKELDFRFQLWDIEGFLLRQHGVVFTEAAALPAELYLYTGKKAYSQMARGAQAMLDKYHMLVDGVPSSQEALNGNQPDANHETCDISSSLWTRSYLLLAFGDGKQGDAIERIAFNAAPSVVTKDFTAHQYHSGPNQMIATTDTGARRDMSAYRAGHTPECCSGTLNRIMPNFIGNMWLTDKNNGLVAAMYGPADVSWKVGENQTPVTIETKTEYPFRDRIQFVFKPEKPVKFPFTFRVPGWCDKAGAFLNGKKLEQPLDPGTFVTLDREFQPGDQLELVFPMAVRASEWAQSGNGTGISRGMALERGPLVFTEDISENITPFSDPDRAKAKWPENYPVVRSSPRLQAIEVTPGSPWNYALEVDPQNPDRDVKVKESPMPQNPWIKATTPVRLEAPARRVPAWDIMTVRHPWTGKTHRMIPPLPRDFLVSGETETISLVPYGSSLLRLTIFPEAGTAKNAPR